MEQDERQERLLKSLYFPEHNARWNRIENYPRNFQWVFFVPGESEDEIEGYAIEGHESEEVEGSEYGSEDPTARGEGRARYGSDASDTPIPNFIAWLRSDSKMFRISGKPASGNARY